MQQYTRKEKLKLLRELQAGKITINSLRKPFTAVLFGEGEYITAEEVNGQMIPLKEPMTLEDYKATLAQRPTLVIILEDYSKPFENNNKIQ